MRKRGTAVQDDVLKGKQKLPERLGQIRILAPQGQQKIDCENEKVGRQDPQSPACVESSQIQTVIARELREKLAANHITAKNKEKIYTDPTPAVHATRRRKTHDAGVINHNSHDSHRPKENETGLP